MSKQTKVERVWETTTGLWACAILTGMGHRCGYVGVSDAHPLHGVDYSQETDCLEFPSDEAVGKRGIIPLLAGSRRAPDVVFDVHGGLTFSGPMDWIEAAPKGLWFFGFDCAHHGDAPEPGYTNYSVFSGGVVRSLEYVAGECESLAAQLINRVRNTDTTER